VRRHLALFALALALLLPAVAPAQLTLSLSTFGGSGADGAVLSGTTWVGNLTQNAGSLTVGGTAGNDNGWGASGLTLNAATMGYVAITARRDAGNLAPSLFVQFVDANVHTQVFSVSTSLFSTSAFTTVYVPIGTWDSEFLPTQISSWSIGGGNVGSTTFHLTLDELAFTTTTAAVPEPAATALLAALGAVAVATLRRRRLRP
jgi:hypothetical protein